MVSQFRMHVKKKRVSSFETHAEWKALFPSPQTITIPDTSLVPKFWVDKLNAAVAAKKIPDIPPSNASVYPPGVDPISAEVCSGTYKCIIPGDIWEGPDGVFASSFDDGPTPVSCFN